MLFYGDMDDSTVIVCHGAQRYSAYTGYLDSFTFDREGTLRELGDLQRDAVYTKNESICTMDAVYHDHYSKLSNLRDIQKAYLCFKEVLEYNTQPPETTTRRVSYPHDESESAADSRPAVPYISTGKWGCGVFGGHPPHKFLQQVIAAQLAACDATGVRRSGVELVFSSFNDPDFREGVEAHFLPALLDAKRGITPRQLLNMIVERGDKLDFKLLE